MAITTRDVLATWYLPNAELAVDEPIVFHLIPGSYVANGMVPTGAVEDTTNDVGQTATTLWTNADGFTPTRWIVTNPRGEQHRFVLWPGDGPISLVDLINQEEHYPWRENFTDEASEIIKGDIFGQLADTVDIALGDALVGSRHPGAGAVGRTVHDRLADAWTAADFGASPAAPAAVNAAALNAAIAALATAGGGTLALEAGRYLIDQRLILQDGVHLAGRGEGVTILDFTTAADGAFNADAEVETPCCIAAQGPGSTVITGLASDVAQNAKTLTFSADMTGVLAPGDVVKIHNPANHSYAWFRPYYLAGEYVYVLAVAGAEVTLARPTYAAYSAASVVLYRSTFARVGLSGMTIHGKQEPSSVDPAVVWFSYCTGLLIDNVELHGSDNVHVFVQQCTQFTVRHARVRYYSDFGGTNYGVNVNNAQDGMIEGCELAVSRHALTHGGAHAEGVPTRNIQVNGGRFEGRGVNTNGAIAYHGNCENNLVVGAEIINGVTWSGHNNTLRDCQITTGHANVAIGGSELVSADHTFANLQITIRTPLVSNLGSAQGAIHLSFMSALTRNGTMRLHNVTIDMNGYAGEPVEFYNISEAAIHWDIKNLTVVNANRAAGISLLYWRCAAGHKFGRMLFSDCSTDGVDLRLEGCGPSLARWTNHVATNPSSNGIAVLANDMEQSTYQHRATENGVPKKLVVSYDQDGNVIAEDADFDLAAGDAVYFSYTVRFTNIWLQFNTVNTNAATLTWEYWNGTTWTALPAVSDGTVLAGVPLAQPIWAPDPEPPAPNNAVAVTWTMPPDWVKAYLDFQNPAHPEYNETRDHAWNYWVRARTSAPLTTVTMRTMVTKNLTQPVTEEAVEIIDPYIRGATAAGVFVTGTSQAFSTLRVTGGDLSNNGSSDGGGSSAKTSIYLAKFVRAELAGVALGDTRAPAGGVPVATDPYAMYLWTARDITALDVRTVRNVNTAGLAAVSESTTTRYYPAARAYRGTTGVTPAHTAWTAVGLTAETFDGDNLHFVAYPPDPGSNPSRIVVKEAGRYICTGSISFANNVVGSRGVRLRLNGGSIFIAQTMVGAAQGTDTTDITATGIYLLAANDYIEVLAYQSSGGPLALVLGPSALWLTVHRLV